MRRLGAVILAAGISSRMNAFKPLLPVDGSTMIARVVAMMQKAGADPIVVVAGYKGAVLEKHLSQHNVVFVHNKRYWDTQMLDSLLLGLKALEGCCKAALISPADVPLVSPETVADILKTDGQFVRPTYNGEPGHPVLLNMELIPVLAQYEGEGGLRGAVEAGNVILRELEVSDKGVVMDSDTEESYTQLLRHQRGITQRPLPLEPEIQIDLRAESLFWKHSMNMLLEMVQATGSLESACKCVHIEEAAGRALLSEAERQLGYAIIAELDDKTAALTKEGHCFYEKYRLMRKEIFEFAKESFYRHFKKDEGDSP